MELRLNVVFLTLMALAVLGMTSTDPKAAFDSDARSSRRLAGFEDEAARQPDSVTAMVDLLGAYLDEGHYDLAIAAAGRARPAVAASPEVQHRLSRAHEGMRNYGLARDAASRAESACLERPSCPQHRRAIFALHRDALTRAARLTDPTEAQVAAAYSAALNATALRGAP